MNLNKVVYYYSIKHKDIVATQVVHRGMTYFGSGLLLLCMPVIRKVLLLHGRIKKNVREIDAESDVICDFYLVLFNEITVQSK